MPAVVALSEYRERKRVAVQIRRVPPGPRPVVTDGDILGRDYTRFEDAVFGLLKVRDIFDHHLPFEEEWKHHLLCLLHAVYHGAAEKEELSLAAAMLRRLAAEEMEGADPAMGRDLSCALLILDLLEKVRLRAGA